MTNIVTDVNGVLVFEGTDITLAHVLRHIADIHRHAATSEENCDYNIPADFPQLRERDVGAAIMLYRELKKRQ